MIPGRSRAAPIADVTCAEAEIRAHDRVSPADRYGAIAAVNLYVEAFLAGARYTDDRREVAH